MISPLQVLFYLASTLAPAGSHHVIISGGDQVYKWDKGDSVNDAATWVYDSSVDPKLVLANNDIVPSNPERARNETSQAVKKDEGCYTLRFDPAHELQKTSQGYVYIVRPGAANEKFYSFVFR